METYEPTTDEVRRDLRQTDAAMASRRFTFASSELSLPEAKTLARRAYGRARVAGSLSSVVVDRLWSDTLLAVEHQPAATATEMLVRAQHLFVLIEDRTTWPRE